MLFIEKRLPQRLMLQPRLPMRMLKLSERWRFFIQLILQFALLLLLLYQQSVSPSIFMSLSKLFRVRVASMLVTFAFAQLPDLPGEVDQDHSAILK